MQFSPKVKDVYGELITSDKNLCEQLNQLALADAVIGIQARAANNEATSTPRLRRALKEIRELKSSTTWLAGRIVLVPALFAKRLIQRNR